jgi:proteasome lid subunit RPN8/RPN11
MRRRESRDPEIQGLRRVCESVIYPHIFENADREVGGVLIGGVGKAGTLPIVFGAIQAIAADERRAALTFTQEAWAHVHRVIDEEYPNDQIVGWYHSHPSFGIFLSEHDLFIHRNFFSNRSQIALVVDPISREEGIFAWTEDDRIDLYLQRPTKDGWQPRVAGEVIPSRAPRGRVDAADSRESSERAGPTWPFLAVCIAVFAAAFTGAFLQFHRDSGREPSRHPASSRSGVPPATSSPGVRLSPSPHSTERKP